MVRIRTKVGPKGQIVIPKVFRDEYNISPGDEVIFEENNQALLVKRYKEDIVKFFEETAKKIKLRKFDLHAIEEQYEERWKKAQRYT